MNVQAQALATFDLDNLLEVQKVTHNCDLIYDADGNALAGLIMVGKNSAEYMTAARLRRIDSIQRGSKRKAPVDSASHEGAVVVADSIEENDRAIAMAVVVGWYGFSKGGHEVAFDKNVVENMFDRAPQWQVKVLNDLEIEANFMPTSSDNSSPSQK